MSKINNDDVYELCEGEYYEHDVEETNIKAREFQIKKQREEKEENDYRSHCIESYLFTKDDSNREDFAKLIEITDKIKELKKQSEDLRKSILERMKECKCTRAIDLKHKRQLTISQAGHHSRKEFDEDRFKREHPDLYEQYKIKRTSYSMGGTLVLKAITDKAYKYYTKNSNKGYFE